MVLSSPLAIVTREDNITMVWLFFQEHIISSNTRDDRSMFDV